MEIGALLAIDITILVGCFYFLSRHVRLTFSHPAVTYLIFHAIIVTFRLFTILRGSPLLFDGPSWSARYLPITHDELAAAVVLAEIGLVTFTLGCLKAAADTQARTDENQPSQRRTLSERNILIVAVPTFIIGLIGLYSTAYLPFERETIDLGAWGTSSWLIITQFWSTLALLALIYYYGLRWQLLILLVPLVFVLSIQGGDRFRVLIALIFVTQVYLDRKGKKWPPIVLWVPIILFALIFVSLKQISSLIRVQANLDEIVARVVDTINTTYEGSGDLWLLDALGGYKTAIDDSGQFYLGSTYATMIFLPIPRPLWPDKPGLSDFVIDDLSNSQRPFGRMGISFLLVGESYANFGYPGVMIIPFLFSYGLSRFYYFARQRNYYTEIRLFHLLFQANFILFYRSGLRAIVIFVIVNMMPLIIIVLLHRFSPSDEVLAQRLADGKLIKPIWDFNRLQKIRRMADSIKQSSEGNNAI